MARISAGTICRHTWASWHVQNGTPLYALQEMGGLGEPGNGWRGTRILPRNNMAPYADRLCALRAVAAESDGTNKA